MIRGAQRFGVGVGKGAAGVLAALLATTPAVAGESPRLDCSWCELRHGVNLQYDSAAAHFHLRVDPRRDGREPTQIWRLGPQRKANDAARRAWSLGLTADVADARHGLERIEAVPQLQLDGKALFRAAGDCRISLQYSRWRSEFQNDRAGARALQLQLRWQF